jgi:hypothetical protein
MGGQEPTGFLGLAEQPDQGGLTPGEGAGDQLPVAVREAPDDFAGGVAFAGDGGEIAFEAEDVGALLRGLALEGGVSASGYGHHRSPSCWCGMGRRGHSPRTTAVASLRRKYSWRPAACSAAHATCWP